MVAQNIVVVGASLVDAQRMFFGVSSKFNYLITKNLPVNNPAHYISSGKQF